jgi:hypothetical protein
MSESFHECCFNKLQLVMILAAPNFGPYKSFYFNPEEGKYFIRVKLPKDTPIMKISSCYKNNPICGKKLRRPHSICFSCWYLKRQRGEIPEYNEVQLIISPIRIHRPSSYWLNVIGKKLHEVLKYVWE